MGGGAARTAASRVELPRGHDSPCTNPTLPHTPHTAAALGPRCDAPHPAQELFSKHGYAQASAHKATHDKFLADCGAVTEVDDDVIKFLKRWLVTHVKGSDMKYVAPLTSAGAE